MKTFAAVARARGGCSVSGAAFSGDQMSLPAFEKALLCEALRRTEGNQVQAAALLDVSRMVLRSRMKRYGLV